MTGIVGGKSALVVDTNRALMPVVLALEEMGIRVGVVGRDGVGPLSSLVDDAFDADYSDVQRVEELIRAGGFDYLVPGCTDTSYLTCSALVGGTHPGIDPLAVSQSLIDKEKFAVLAQHLGLDIPRTLSVADAEGFSGRVIVKPPNAHSGLGVSVVDPSDSRALADAVQDARGVAGGLPCIVQELVEGQLFSHSAFVRGGSIAVDFFVREDCVVDPFAVDLSRVDRTLDDSVRSRARWNVMRLVDELVLVDGLVHTQFICRDGVPHIIDITRRCPGDLYSELIRLSTGWDYALHYLLPFLGVPTIDPPAMTNSRFIVRHTMMLEEGRFWGMSTRGAVNIPLLVPLAVTGDGGQHGEPIRLGVIFLEAGDIDEETAIYEEIRQRRLLSTDPMLVLR